MNHKLHSHFKIYKPFGMLSQKYSNDSHQKRKHFLGELYAFDENTFPIGRLDEKSEGLLLMTSDGKLMDDTNRGGSEKEYYAQLTGNITQKEIEQLKKGLEIGLNGGKYLTKPCRVFKLDTPPDLPIPDKRIRVGMHGKPNSWISITITEGKFRQVRKMTSAVGFPTIRLVRVRIGNLHLNHMLPGDVTKLDRISI